ncbi:MAG: glucuronate isomerase, partial [Sphingobacteriales bacterium]
MKSFLDDNFLLQTKTAERLYHDYAAQMPIIDYHCHLDPAQMAANINFENLTAIWLKGDHYKWRAMRANGVNEQFITGNSTDWEKFEKWAETVPYTLRNPLYHWTHLELQRYFDIDDLLTPTTAKKIYDNCTEKLQMPQFTVQNIISRMNVEVICTTDDPIDDLEHHKKLNQSNWGVRVYPTFRPDKAMNTDDLPALNQYINKLEQVSDVAISTFDNYLTALKKRHDYFVQHGCHLSDHGLEQIYAENYTDEEVSEIFNKIRSNKPLLLEEELKFKSAMLYAFAIWNNEKGWVQQFHLGALRNNNSRGYRENGPDTGYDSMGDFSQARSMSRFFNRLDNTGELTKT